MLRYRASRRELVAAGIKAPPVLYAAMRWLAHAINRFMWHVEITAPWEVPEHGPVILAPVHRSFLDFFVASEATARPVAFMAKSELWRSKLLGRFLAAFGAFPVNRSGVDRKALERSEEVLSAGAVLVVFPEGERKTGPEIEKLLDGVVFLATRTGAAIVPIGLAPTERVMPKGTKLPKRMPVQLVLGRCLDGRDGSGGARVRRAEILQKTALLRRSLQDAFDEARALAGETGALAGDG